MEKISALVPGLLFWKLRRGTLVLVSNWQIWVNKTFPNGHKMLKYTRCVKTGAENRRSYWANENWWHRLKICGQTVVRWKPMSAQDSKVRTRNTDTLLQLGVLVRQVRTLSGKQELTVNYKITIVHLKVLLTLILKIPLRWRKMLSKQHEMATSYLL